MPDVAGGLECCCVVACVLVFIFLVVSYRLMAGIRRKERGELKEASADKLQASDRYDLEGTPLGIWQLAVAEGLVAWLKELQAPVGFGIFGGWGVGKTGLLRALEKKLIGESLPVTRVTASELSQPKSDEGVLSGLANRLSKAGNNDSCYVLIDEIDKADSEAIGNIISGVARFQVETETFLGHCKLPRQTYFVLAGNLQRILEKLSTMAGGTEDADELVACAVAQRFYPTSADPDIAVSSFWPITPDKASEVSTRGDEDSGKVNSPENVIKKIGFLLRYSRRLSTSNLRHLRQTIASLSYFSKTYASAPYKKLIDALNVSDKFDESLKDNYELLWNICLFALAILIRVRMEYPEVYVEWTSRSDNIDAIVEGLAALEDEFSSARAGTMPTGEESVGVQRAAQIFGGAGFDLTRDLLRESGKGAFLRFYRDIRRQLIKTISLEPEIGNLSDTSGLLSKSDKFAFYKRELIGEDQDVGAGQPHLQHGQAAADLPAADSLEEFFRGRYNEAVIEYWKEFLRQ